jgi:hypothetical protein
LLSALNAARPAPSHGGVGPDGVAERRGKGLQSPVRGFESRRRLHLKKNAHVRAPVVYVRIQVAEAAPVVRLAWLDLPAWSRRLRIMSSTSAFIRDCLRQIATISIPVSSSAI